MRHKIQGRKLNRTSSHRRALLINLTTALLKHELIKTTLPKAKELRSFAEKVMTVSKVDNLPNRRKLLSILRDGEIVNKLLSDIGPRIKNRNGGYIRIMHYGFRVGDKAPMALIELVDRKTEQQVEPTESKKVVSGAKKAVKVAKKTTSEKKPTDAKKASGQKVKSEKKKEK